MPAITERDPSSGAAQKLLFSLGLYVIFERRRWI